MWKTVKLGDICKIVNGSTPSRKEKTFWRDGDISWFTIDDMREQGRDIFTTAQHVTQRAVEEKKVKLVSANSVLLCCTASIGEAAIARKEMATNQQFNSLTPLTNDLSCEYLYYVATTLKDKLLRVSGSTTISFVSIRKLKEIEIPLPPLAEQQRIVAKLDATFAEIDRAVGIEGEKLLEAENLRAAYLDKRLKTLLHEKPSVCLSDVCERVSVGHVGTTSKYYCDDGIPFIRTQNVSKTGFDDTELRYVTPEFHESLKKSQLKAGDVLLSRVVIDEMRTAIVPENYGEANCANVILIRPKDKLMPQYLSLLIKSRESQKYFMGVKKGAAQQVVNTGILKKWNIPLPSIDEQTKFIEEITTNFEFVKSILTSVTSKKHALSNLKSAILAQELQSPQSEAA